MNSKDNNEQSHNVLSWALNKIFSSDAFSESNLVHQTHIEYTRELFSLIKSSFNQETADSSASADNSYTLAPRMANTLQAVLAQLESHISVHLRDSSGIPFAAFLAIAHLVLCEHTRFSGPAFLHWANDLCLQALHATLAAVAVVSVPERVFPRLVERLLAANLDINQLSSLEFGSVVSKCTHLQGPPLRNSSFSFKCEAITPLSLAIALNLTKIAECLIQNGASALYVCFT